MLFRNILIFLLAICTGLILYGCRYEPDGEFFEEVDDRRVSLPGIHLDEVNGIIALNERTHFSYKVATSQQLIETKVFFGDQEIEDSHSQYNSSFTLDPKNYEEGRYSLKVVTATGSGTGSLADKLEAEYVQAEETWTVIIERPKPVNITTVIIDSGSIRLEWEAYKPLEFEAFSHYEIAYDGHYGGILATIEDPTITSFYDSTFFYGTREYQVNVRTEHHTADGEGMLYEYPHSAYQPNLQAELTNDTLAVRWGLPVLYSNIGTFQVSFCCDGDQHISAEVNGTSFITPFKMNFGDARSVSLRVRRGYNNHFRSYEYSYYDSEELFSGEKINVRSNILFSPATQFYYSIYQEDRYSNRILRKQFTAELVEQTPGVSRQSNSHFQFAMSYDGQIAYEYSPADGKIMQIDPVTLEDIETYNAKELFRWDDETGVTNVSIADNNVVAFSSYKDRPPLYGYGNNDFPPIYDQSFVLNMEDTSILKEFATPEPLILSPNGEFLVAADTLYQRSGSSYVSVAVLDGTRRAYRSFKRTNPNYFIIAESSTVKVYDCDKLDFISSTPFPTQVFYFSIDPFTNLVGAFKHESEKYYVLDVADGSIETIDIFATPNDSYYNQNYFLRNGILFSERGFYLKLTEWSSTSQACYLAY